MQGLNQLEDISNRSFTYEKKPKTYYDDWFIDGKKH